MSTPSRHYALDILIPVYNEGENIIDVLTSLKQFVTTPFQVLICYDNEDDNTLPVIKKYKEGFGIEIIKNKEKGVHGAIITGFEASDADCVIVFPADDTFNAHILDEMYRKYKEGCDVVVASRFMEGGRMEGCPLLKSILVRTASFTLYWFGNIPVQDASNGFRLFSRRLLDHVSIESSEGFTYSLELLVKCHRLGWKIGEVPASWFEREKGNSRFHVLQWIPYYLRWYIYGFLTTWFRL